MPKLSSMHLFDEREAVIVIDPLEGAQVIEKGAPEPEDALHLRFRPYRYTRDYEERLESGDNNAKTAIENVLLWVSQWDLQNNDGKPIPLEEAALKPLSTKLLNEVVAGCVLSLRPNPARSGA